jgi:large subunit ribosomal protein L28
MAKRLGGVGRKIVRTSKRRFLPNLKKVRAIIDGSKKTITICVECLKSGKVTKVV